MRKTFEPVTKTFETLSELEIALRNTLGPQSVVLEILWLVAGVLGRHEALTVQHETHGPVTMTLDTLRPVNVSEMLKPVKIVRETSGLVKLMLEMPRTVKQV